MLFFTIASFRYAQYARNARMNAMIYVDKHIKYFLCLTFYVRYFAIVKENENILV